MNKSIVIPLILILVLITSVYSLESSRTDREKEAAQEYGYARGYDQASKSMSKDPNWVSKYTKRLGSISRGYVTDVTKEEIDAHQSAKGTYLLAYKQGYQDYLDGESEPITKKVEKVERYGPATQEITESPLTNIDWDKSTEELGYELGIYDAQQGNAKSPYTILNKFSWDTSLKIKARRLVAEKVDFIKAYKSGYNSADSVEIVRQQDKGMAEKGESETIGWALGYSHAINNQEKDSGLIYDYSYLSRLPKDLFDKSVHHMLPRRLKISPNERNIYEEGYNNGYADGLLNLEE